MYGLPRIELYLSKRKFEVDIIKAVAIIMLLIYHIYISVDDDFYSGSDFYMNVAELAGVIGLSLFFFISGLSLYINNKITRLGDVIFYLKKRVIRIYPLYWLFLGAVLFAYHLSTREIIIYITGFQVLFYPVFIPTLTYHFITAILIFYLMFPVIAFFSGDNKKMPGIIILFFIVLLTMKVIMGFTDNMVIVYYSLFIGGIFAGRFNLYHKLKQIKIGNYLPLALVTLAVFSALAFTFSRGTWNPYVFMIVQNVTAIIFAVLALYLAICYVNKFGLANFTIVSVIAYSTYAIFLINMPVFNAIDKLSSSFDLSGLETAALMVLSVPVMIAIAYLLQLYESKIIKKITAFLEKRNALMASGKSRTNN